MDAWWKITCAPRISEDFIYDLLIRGAHSSLEEPDGSWSVFFKGTDDAFHAFLSQAKALGSGIVRSEAVANENWVRQCEELWHPVQCGTLTVTPVLDSSDFLPQDQQIGIIPGMGFGTGHHPTTQLVIEQMCIEQKNMNNPQRILDVGTGSGILAIASQKLFQPCILDAIDIDPEALSNARENLILNGLENRVTLRCTGPESLGGPYHLILANLFAEVLCSLRAEFERLLAPKGMLLMSGILQEYTSHIQSSFLSTEGMISFEMRSQLERAGWAAMALIRK